MSNAPYDAGLVRVRHTNAASLSGARPVPDSTPFGNITFCARCDRERPNGRTAIGDLCMSCRGTTGAEPTEAKEETPCHMDDEFFALDNAATDRAEELSRGRRVDRAALAAEFRPQVRDKFCGHCPVRDACLSWAKDERYTGLAGGELLIAGEVIEPVLRCRNGHVLTPESVTRRGNRQGDRCQQCDDEYQERRRVEGRQ